MNTNKIKFALLGCGNIGQRHAAQMARTGLLTAVCDVKTARASELSEKYNTKAITDIEVLLQQDFDVAAVCTPNGLHAQHTIKLLNAGKHVLCEKPLCITAKDGQAMIAAATQANKKLFIVKQNRYNPPVVAVKELIRENALGKVNSFQVNCFWNRPADYYNQSDWRGTKNLDGGILYTQFSHFIDLLYWLLGDVIIVNGIIANLQHQSICEFEDSGNINLVMKNGAIGSINYTVNAFEKNMEGSITLFGEKATVKIGGEYLNELSYLQPQHLLKHPLPPAGKPNSYGTYNGSMSNHNKVYDHLVEALKQNTALLPEGEEGLASVKIIEKIYQSATFIK
jgi:UDP-N-acetyl-2-amino-2-deoxyglucuronate dehydrogenase